MGKRIAFDLERRKFIQAAGGMALLNFLGGCRFFPAQNKNSENCESKGCGELDVGYGTKINYKLIHATGKNPTAVFCHGFNGDLFAAETLLSRSDFSILTFSYPGDYNSGAFPPEVGNTIPNVTSCLEKLLAYSKEEDFISGTNEIFVGFSMGAKVLENYLSQHPEEQRGFVLVNGQDTPCQSNVISLLNLGVLAEGIQNPLRDLRPLFEYVYSLSETNSSAGFRRCTNPTLIFSSEYDELIPVEEMRAMAAAKPNSKYYELAGESHDPSQKGIEEIRRIMHGEIDFLMSSVR